MPKHPIPTRDGFRADIMIAGVRYRRRFPRDKYSDPYAAASNFLRDITAPTSAATLLVDDLAEYHRWSERDRKKAPHTVRNYRQMLGEIAQFLNQMGVKFTSEISVEHVRAYRSHFTSETDRGDNTWGKYRQALAAFLNWARSRGITASNPATEREFKIPFDKKPPETFEKEEIAAILKYLDDREPEMAVAMRFLFYTGARVGEMIKLEWKDTRLGSNPVVVIGSKTKHKRTVPVSPLLLPGLKGLPRSRQVGPFNLTEKRVYLALQRACYIADIPARPVHAIRHSFCRYLFENGTDINLISKLMGHRDIRTTMVYAAHFSLERATGAVESLNFG